MKSRYQGLRVFGTLALIIAWVVLILGIVGMVGLWLGIQSLTRSLEIERASLPSLLGALPPLLFGILGFIQFYIIGKVLRLLVDVDENTLNLQPQAGQPVSMAAAGGGNAEISGELKRSAKLIAANLEATQSLQQQVMSLHQRLGGLPASEVVLLPPAGEPLAISEP